MRALFFGDVPHRLAGAQKSLLLSLSRLAAHGVEPVVAFPHGGLFEEASRRAGLDVRIVESPPAFQSFGRALMRLSAMGQLEVMVRQLIPFARRLARIAERERVDVMHFNTPRGITMAGAAARFAGVPAVMHLRGVPAISRAYWLPSQALGDAFVLVARALEPYFAPSVRPRARVVYNGVALPPPLDKNAARAALREQMALRGVEIPETARLVASVSSLTPFKGLHHLLAAAMRIVREGHDVAFLCAGTGSGEPYEAWLRQRVDQSQLGPRFRLLGFWEDVHLLLSAADVVVLPSVQQEVLDIGTGPTQVRGTEGLPRAVLESFAARTPVVATDIAGVREQVEHGRTGLVVRPADVDELAAALVRAVGDPVWREAAGNAGREMVAQRFTVDGAAAGLAAVLREQAAAPPSSLERGRRLLRLAGDVARRRV